MKNDVSISDVRASDFHIDASGLVASCKNYDNLENRFLDFPLRWMSDFLEDGGEDKIYNEMQVETKAKISNGYLASIAGKHHLYEIGSRLFTDWAIKNGLMVIKEEAIRGERVSGAEEVPPYVYFHQDLFVYEYIVAVIPAVPPNDFRQRCFRIPAMYLRSIAYQAVDAASKNGWKFAM